ncbi:uncharacterized protein LOC112155726 isoform X2 [Oryzias melastigma]|uniref:Uncharacterized LOC112155726 n=1 Tax=Oryzias melastigma TaxID=30732 RepID=A0A3B3CXF3_ORYME|nr:uncharacterized protein LOC112155726 isoform X2 [Oryzias melastigma]
MSYQRFPLPPGSPNSQQGQHGLSGQESERDSWKGHPPFGTQASFAPSMASSASRSSADVMIQPRQRLPETFRPQQGGALDKYYDKYLRRDETMQPEERMAYSSSTKLEKSRSTSTGVNNPTPETFEARQLEVQRSGGSRFDLSYHLSEFERSGALVPTTSGERRDDERCIPGSVPDSSGPPQDPCRSKYSLELAANILERFGLEKEDLDYLLNYPEDQITVENLPQILKQIRSQKEKSMSVPEMHTATTSSFSGMSRTIGSGGAETSKDKVPSDPSLVINYGYAEKYSQAGKEILKKFAIDSDQSKSQRPGPEVAEKRKDDKVLKQKSSEQQPKLPSQLDQVLKQLQKKSQLPAVQQTSSVLQKGQGLQPISYPIANPGSTFPFGPQSFSFPPGVTQAFPRFTNYYQMIRPPPWQYTTQETAMGGQPTPTMINDYVATMPTMFPHICSLCNVLNPALRDWISHQNTSQHLENCKLFRTHFPFWDGHIPPLQSDAGPGAAQSTYGTSTQPQYQNQLVGSSSQSGSSDTRTSRHSPTPPFYLLNRRKSSSRSRSRSWSRRHKSHKRRRRSRSRSSRHDHPSSSRHDHPSSSRRDRPSSSRRERSSSSRRERSSSLRRDRPSSSRHDHPSSSRRERSSSSRRDHPSSTRRERSSSSRRDHPSSSRRKRSSSSRRDHPSSSRRERSTSSRRDRSSSSRRDHPSFLRGERSSSSRRDHPSSSRRERSSSSRRDHPLSSRRDRSPSSRRDYPSSSRLDYPSSSRRERSSSSRRDHPLSSRRDRSSSSRRDRASSSRRERSSSSRRDRPSSSRLEHSSPSHRERSSSSQREHHSTSSHHSRSKRSERLSSSRKTDEKRSSKRKSPEAQPDLQSATKRLTEKLMETSAAQGLTPAAVEDMVKTLAPVLVAELSKMKPVPSSPSPTRSHSHQDSKEDGPSETIVTIRAHSDIAHKDLLDALEKIGKTKSLVIYRSQSQAQVRFENDEDAEKLGSLGSLTLNETSLSVVKIKKSKRPRSPVDESSHKPCREPDASAEDTDTDPGKTSDEAQENLNYEKPSSSEFNVEKEQTDPQVEVFGPTEPAEKLPLTEQPSADPEKTLTVGENLRKHLNRRNFRFFMNKNKCFTETFDKTLLLVNKLPVYSKVSYTEEDIAAHLFPYGFIHTNTSLYVIPQSRMAVVEMPSVMDLQNLVFQTFTQGIRFKESRLTLRPFNNSFSMSWFGFYKSLMGIMHFDVFDEGERTVYIHDIAFRQIDKLREDLRDLVEIRNFLPLMNRLFIEFESILDADRFGIWLSSQARCHNYTVYRMRPPRCPAGIPTAPEWRTPPFWMTMRTAPFLYPAVTHPFPSPVCVPVDLPADIPEATVLGSEFATIMLGGLPEYDYTHRDVARLVWPFFSVQNYKTLNENIYVLPLQRRAFVFFSSWTACLQFLEVHVQTPVSLQGHPLSVQVVLENIHPGVTQSNIYQSLIKWSSPLTPNPEFLNNRLLALEMSETSAALIMMVIEVVESIVPFVNFLPLANLIYIEMKDVTDVIEVQLKISCMDSIQLPPMWTKVKRILPMGILQQRLTLYGPNPLTLPSDPFLMMIEETKSTELSPAVPSNSSAYIANNRVPRASAVAARGLIAAELHEEEPRRTKTPGSGVTAKTETSPDLPQMGAGSQLTSQSLESNSPDVSAQEKKTKGDEDKETIEGDQTFPGPLKDKQRNEDLKESQQIDSSHGSSNKCPEGGAVAEEGGDLVPEKPAADGDQELETNQEQSPRGDKGKETCSTSKDESSELPAADPIKAEDDHLKLVTMTNQARDPENKVLQEPMEHDGTVGEDYQPSKTSKMTEERMEPAPQSSSSAEDKTAEERKTTDVETPTDGDDTKKTTTIEAEAAPEETCTETPEERVLRDDQPTEGDNTKKTATIEAEAAPEETCTETPEKRVLRDDQPTEGDNTKKTTTIEAEETCTETPKDHQPTAAHKPKRGRPKKNVPAATQKLMKTRESSRNANEEKSDFTQPEVRSKDDEEEVQKTSTNQKHSDNTEQAVKMEEETEEDQNLTVTPRPRGRPRKIRSAPVRRSARRNPRTEDSCPSVQADRTDEQEEDNTTEEATEPDGPESKRPRSEPLPAASAGTQSDRGEPTAGQD